MREILPNIEVLYNALLVENEIPERSHFDFENGCAII